MVHGPWSLCGAYHPIFDGFPAFGMKFLIHSALVTWISWIMGVAWLVNMGQEQASDSEGFVAPSSGDIGGRLIVGFTTICVATIQL